MPVLAGVAIDTLSSAAEPGPGSAGVILSEAGPPWTCALLAIARSVECSDGPARACGARQRAVTWGGFTQHALKY
jgi:hypothetical protein